MESGSNTTNPTEYIRCPHCGLTSKKTDGTSILMEAHRNECSRVSFNSEDGLHNPDPRPQSTISAPRPTTSQGNQQLDLVGCAVSGLREMTRELKEQKGKVKDAENRAKDAENRAQAADTRITELEREKFYLEEQLQEERDGHLMEIEDLHKMYQEKLRSDMGQR
ncbi:hypothetical protein PG984_005159 [Apiospora sp. TS-2023a]